MRWTPNCRIILLAIGITLADQGSKLVVMRWLGYAQQHVVVDGFFKFVHWGNTGAAWSLFYGNNDVLALVSLLALLLLWYSRHHFEAHTWLGQLALGLILGGIVGNLADRLNPQRQHVIDFIRFYVYRRGEGEVGFPAFNVADSAICTGVALLFLLAWRQERLESPPPPRKETPPWVAALKEASSPPGESAEPAPPRAPENPSLV